MEGSEDAHVCKKSPKDKTSPALRTPPTHRTALASQRLAKTPFFDFFIFKVSRHTFFIEINYLYEPHKIGLELRTVESC